ncbi:siderophore biosynthesis protein [Roseobacter cerasinus]|uniref:Siderophore biosynthesis protein n=2 Tax=Roseobacter cerasinus TaxID=2602289 RepID=A0A640VS90_9RHOB|nr:siderophore biosynthesis protein [Roseobacter cerasinus]
MLERQAIAPDGAAHRRVLRQFCEALLFEAYPALHIEHDGGGNFHWRLGKRRFQARGYRGAFGRIRLEDDPIMTSGPRADRPANCEDLLQALHLDREAEGSLRMDLTRTAHLTDLTRATANPQRQRAQLPFAQMEAALHEGHPYHPCFKARSGFSDADHMAYGPEAGGRFQLHWLSLDPALVAQTLPGADTFWARELGTPRWQALRQMVQSPRQLLPVHPWQLGQLRAQPLYQAWQAAGRVQELGAWGDRYVASQSVRTLMNADAPTRAHVKTAMAMRNTSALRILEPHSVCVAPAISNWLAAVCDSDPLFGTELRLKLLKEYAGVIAGRDTPLAGHLAAIWRESPEGIGIASDAVLPFNALCVIEEDGHPLIDPWIRSLGLERWLDQLLRVSVLPVWHLMIAHGIGLEAHGQNLLLEHDGGWPTGLVARDFHESLEYVPELLSHPDLLPDLSAIDPVYANAPPDRFHRMSTAEALRELVVDTLFIYNLADLSALLHGHYGLPEAEFWRRVRRLLDTHANRHGLQARQRLFDPFAPRILTESLITQKLLPRRNLCRHRVANALHHAKGDTDVHPE